jgi:anti-anti-sigma factor
MSIEGEIDLYSSIELKAKLTGFKKNENVLIDMKEVNFIDSSGLSALISSIAALNKTGGRLKLFHLSKSVKTVFKATNLNHFFQIFDDEATALESFSQPS